ncbi:WDcontaining protein 19 [Angomonas deanei]|nr:WDcontaining protein 19 [Angomonas deanei]|eukprot:EPY29840.1 WDcontaining protein 19 [Angomonas deanei]
MAVVNLGNALQVINLKTKEHFMTQFENTYGTISAIDRASELGTVVGFSSGKIGLAMMADNGFTLVGTEKASSTAVNLMAFGQGSGLACVKSDKEVKMFNKVDNTLREVKENNIPIEDPSLSRLEWSPDGQKLAIAYDSGKLELYSLNVQSVTAVCGSLLFYLISDELVGVKNIREGRVLCNIKIDVEPEKLSAGMGALAVTVGKSVYYYEYFIPNTMPAAVEQQIATASGKSTQESFSHFIRKVDYASTVDDVKVSSVFAAVMFGGRVEVHKIRQDDEAATLSLPQGRGAGNMVAIGMSEPLLLYATQNEVGVVALHNMQIVAQNQRSNIKLAFPNPTCTRLAYIDTENALFIYNPISDVGSVTEGYARDHSHVLWDQGDPTVFVTHNKKEFITFVSVPYSRLGSVCESILIRDSNDNLTTPLPPDYNPVSCLLGSVFCQSPTGSLETVPLLTYRNIHSKMPDSDAFYNNFSLNQLRAASQNISSPQEAEDLAIKALHMLDIDLAIRVYRQLAQPNLVLFLEKIRHIHEKNLLIGHVSMIMGYYKEAQTAFLRSTQPLCALDMRRDFMQWEPALQLAKELAPAQLPIISKQYAQHLEYRGDYTKALEMYKNGKRTLPLGHASTELSALQQEVRQHNLECQEGMGRNFIRTGDINSGLEIAMKSERKDYIAECAQLCEAAEHYEEAAQLFEKAGDVEKAAALHIEKSHNMKAASRLIPQIESRNIIVKYAFAKEKEGSYKEAEAAFTQAEDWDNVVRLKVDKLNDMHGAYVIVRQTRSANAAALVANTCKKKNEFGTAVEFLVVAKSTKDAFELAKQHNCVFNYESALLSQTPLNDGVAPLAMKGDFIEIAKYYEEQKKPGQAGLYYHIGGDFPTALDRYLEAGQPEDIEKAVEVVGLARNDALTSKPIDYLMGETDGEPKEPSYIFKLYMALGSYEKAAKTSVIIASKEQELGNYVSAHKTLVDACCLLREKKLRVPNDLRRTLMLLHSYIIVKDLMKVQKDGNTACRMLLRAAHNIQKFPKHISTILTTTVLQCLKFDFKKSAFEFACVLIQNEKYRTELNEKNRKKIEGVVRKRGKEDVKDPLENMSPCPICDAPVADTELDCGACKNALPFCIVTGKHLLKNDFTLTPCCGFPAIYSSLTYRLRDNTNCPMCDEKLDINKVQKKSGDEIKELL